MNAIDTYLSSSGLSWVTERKEEKLGSVASFGNTQVLHPMGKEYMNYRLVMERKVRFELSKEPICI